MASEGAFRLIQVHEDEDELVVHAGSGKPAAASGAGAAAGAQPVPKPEPQLAPQPEQAPAGSSPADAAKETTADPARTARQEELRRRAEELAQAEAGLSNPKSHAGTHRAVIIGLVVLVLLVVALSVLPHLR